MPSRTHSLRLLLSHAEANRRAFSHVPRVRRLYTRLVWTTRLRLVWPWLLLAGFFVGLAWLGTVGR